MPKFSLPPLIVSITALIVSLGGVGYSATGGSFILGKANVASSETRLTAGGVPLLLKNTSQPALGIVVPAGVPPMVVNSKILVANLNADFVDGLDSANFARTGRLRFTVNPGGFSSEVLLPDGVAALVTASSSGGASYATILRVGHPIQSPTPIFTKFVGFESAGGGTVTTGTYDESNNQFGRPIIDVDSQRKLTLVTTPLGIRVSNKDTGAQQVFVTVAW
jgi:hypothetical protein